MQALFSIPCLAKQQAAWCNHHQLLHTSSTSQRKGCCKSEHRSLSCSTSSHMISSETIYNEAATWNHLAQQGGAGGSICCLENIRQLIHDGHGQGVHSDASLAAAAGVQQSTLHIPHHSRHQALLVANLDGERLVGVARGQRQQVSGPVGALIHEEYCMDRWMDGWNNGGVSK
jgi:hypothetical protein